MNTSLFLSGESPTVSMLGSALVESDQIVNQLRSFSRISTADEALAAAEALKQGAAFTTRIEAQRKAVKEPVVSLGRRIDELAKELTEPVTGPLGALGRALGAFQQEQRRIEAERLDAQRAEELRIRAEAKRVESEAREKAEREQAELARKQERARSPVKAGEYAGRAMLKEREAEAQAEQRQAAVQEQIVAVRTSVAPTPAARIPGIAMREEIRFEVLDITALFEAAPFLVTILPNVAAIKSALKGLQPGQVLPGVKHWKETATSVR